MEKINNKNLNSTKVELFEDNKLLKVRNLNVSFKSTKNSLIKIVRGIDFDINYGQIVGIVGESGSGKSVFSKALINANRETISSYDEFIIDNVDITKFKKEKMWQSIRGHYIGYIPQDPLTSLNPTRKIGKQLMDALNKNDEWKSKSNNDKKNYLIGLLEKFGIHSPEYIYDQYPHTLSGGMKQRVLIAMIVALKPKLIIADEPTTALDPTIQASVLSLFGQIRQEYNISIILISHNISVVAKFCDYIYVMYAGKIVEKGLRKNIFTEPAHPYTWALISAIPESNVEELFSIKGTPPDMANLPAGDPFAQRNDYALEIDFEKEPPLIKINDNHSAATWLLHPDAPIIKKPKELERKLKFFREAFDKHEK
ncbi:ABC transporter ATP-binding protein [Mycoplasma sp. U97]|uniref:ABC transporter ATP-binding protein n=1 Tax=Mycoplasma tauri TaxID=547987 RepID=UPI001CBC142E|nr:ABC transporter ATP-binding protein [Mycoplasma tauri]MBZ4212835.1 ABC transporter ATP-binding protein [Mycoplasma tauri]